MLYFARWLHSTTIQWKWHQNDKQNGQLQSYILRGSACQHNKQLNPSNQWKKWEKGNIIIENSELSLLPPFSLPVCASPLTPEADSKLLAHTAALG